MKTTIPIQGRRRRMISTSYSKISRWRVAQCLSAKRRWWVAAVSVTRWDFWKRIKSTLQKAGARRLGLASKLVRQRPKKVPSAKNATTIPARIHRHARSTRRARDASACKLAGMVSTWWQCVIVLGARDKVGVLRLATGQSRAGQQCGG